ncbi:MAG: hypothetical protein QOF02_3244 [Blastocatellia bacterium]|jgi:hypothetical protein|nr:hypothetical protein [Blastocatellia bacterium]
MSKDYIPKDKAGRAAWLANFAAKLDDNKAKLSLTDAEVASVSTLQANLVTANQALADAEADYRAKLVAADTADDEATAAARSRVRQLQADPNVEDSVRAELGIPVRDTTPTAPAPLTSRPIGAIDFSQRGQHILEYRDSDTPDSRARPDNATGCEIRRHIGTAPPAGTGDFIYLETDRSSPFTVHYTDEDAGKIASYILRWINANGDKGPWSETVSATITA